MLPRRPAVFPLLALLPLIALAATGPESYRFVILGDRSGGVQEAVFDSVVQSAVRVSPAPAFFINVGDLIPGYENDTVKLAAQWTALKQKLAPVTARFRLYTVPGNHDITTTAAKPFYERLFGRPYYSFNFGPDHFVVLDNSRLARFADFDSAQINWLKADLAKYRTSRRTFCFFHKPLWEVTPLEKTMDNLHKLFWDYGVDYVFNGHEHWYRRGVRDGIVYTVIGSSGGKADNIWADGSSYQYAVVEVSPRDAIVTPVLLTGEAQDANWVSEERAVEIDALMKSVTFKPVAVRPDARKFEGRLEMTAQNPLKEPLILILRWIPPKNCPFTLTGIEPETVSIEGLKKRTFQYPYTATGLTPLPRLIASLPYRGDTLSYAAVPSFAREMRVRKRADPVTIDGELTEKTWTEGRSSPMRFFANGTPWADSCFVSLAYNKDNLYGAFVCYMPWPESLLAETPKTARDTFTQDEDLFRFYFGSQADIESYYRVYITAGGAVRDHFLWQSNTDLAGDASWNGVTQCEVKRTPQGWQGEFMIPWSKTAWDKPAPLLVNFRWEDPRVSDRKGKRAYQMPFDDDCPATAKATLE